MRIIEQKPNLRVSNFTPKSRAYENIPSMKVKSLIPSGKMAKSDSIETTVVTTISQGSPIGLLLALTYANNIITSVTTYSGGLSPNAKIITT